MQAFLNISTHWTSPQTSVPRHKADTQAIAYQAWLRQ